MENYPDELNQTCWNRVDWAEEEVGDFWGRSIKDKENQLFFYTDFGAALHQGVDSRSAEGPDCGEKSECVCVSGDVPSLLLRFVCGECLLNGPPPPRAPPRI